MFLLAFNPSLLLEADIIQGYGYAIELLCKTQNTFLQLIQQYM